MSEENRSKDKWDRLASSWVDAGPPASPSDDDIDNFRSLLLNGTEGTAVGPTLVLGCTPRLRDLLCALENYAPFEVVCVDFSEEMYRATSQCLRCENAMETFVHANWLTMDVGRERFDAIVADKVIDNVMPWNWDRFFERLTYHLRTGGHFITRLAPQNMALQQLTFIDALRKWAERYEGLGESLVQAASGLWEEVLGASAFKGVSRQGTQKTARFEDEVKELSKRKETLTAVQRAVFAEFLRLFWESRNDEWSSYDLDQILHRLEPYFVHESTLYANDYPAASLQPVIRWRRR